MTELGVPMSCSNRAARGYRSNKSLSCIFSEKPADRTKAFKLEISWAVSCLLSNSCNAEDDLCLVWLSVLLPLEI